MSTVADEPGEAVQQAIYDVLAGDSTLAGLVEGVFDHAPEDKPYPFVVIDEATATPDNRHGGFGRQVAATVHVWARSRGFKPAHAIRHRVVELLDHQPLAVAGHHTVSVRYELSQTLTDPEPPGDIRHVPVRFRVITEQP